MNDDMYDQSRGKKYSTDDGSVTSSNVDESQIYSSVQSMDAMLQDMSMINEDLAQNEEQAADPSEETSTSPEETPESTNQPEQPDNSTSKEPSTPSAADAETSETVAPAVISSQSTKKKAPLALIIGIIVALLAVAGVIFLIFNNLNARREDFTSSQSTIARTQLVLSQTQNAADRVVSAIPAGDSVSRGEFESRVADLTSAQESLNEQLLALSEMPALQNADINSEHESFHRAATVYSEKITRILIVFPALFNFSESIANFDIAAITRGDTSSIDDALSHLLNSPDLDVQHLGQEWSSAVTAFVGAFERFSSDPLDPYIQADFEEAYDSFIAQTSDLAPIEWLSDLQTTDIELHQLESYLQSLSDLVDRHSR